MIRLYRALVAIGIALAGTSVVCLAAVHAAAALAEASAR